MWCKIKLCAVTVFRLGQGSYYLVMHTPQRMLATTFFLKKLAAIRRDIRPSISQTSQD
jgi:hypothetical protein